MQLNRRVDLRRVARRDVAAVSPGDRWRNDAESATPKSAQDGRNWKDARFQGGGKVSILAESGRMRVLGDAENAHDGNEWKNDTKSATPKMRMPKSVHDLRRINFCWRVQMRKSVLFGVIFTIFVILMMGGSAFADIDEDPWRCSYALLWFLE